MAVAEATPSFGSELKDGFKPVNAWVSSGIAWLEDIQSFYKERSAIEKEYSSKLSALAKRFHEKKAKKIGSLSVGDTPTLTPGSLERRVCSASLTTWTTQLSTLERRAAEHERYSNELSLQITDPLKAIAVRYEELRKSHAEYAVKLEKERDAAYAALKRSKGHYDAACSDLESRRKKIDSSFDTSKSKAQNAYQQQVTEVHNVKNTYLISINVTNRQKEKHYHEFVPDLLDSLQDLSETRTNHLNRLWLQAAKIENETLSRSVDYMQLLSSEILRNDPKLDSMMFIRHNTAAWQEPPDMGFEPSPVWHDDPSMAVDELSKVYLRNILGKSKGQQGELKREVEQKRREVDKVRAIRQSVREGKDKRDEVELVKVILALQEDLHSWERRWITAEVETTTITSVVGDISIGAQNHNFRSQTFKIPTNCDLCGERIWGLSAKGFDCRDCGYTCHNKCELKVPADCPGEQSKEGKKKLKSERQQATAGAPTQVAPRTNGGEPASDAVHEMPPLSRSNTMGSLSSGYAASAHRSVSGKALAAAAELDGSGAASKPAAAVRKNRIVAPPPVAYVSEAPASDGSNGGPATNAEARAKVMYPYTANGEGEISVDEGTEVIVVEPDDGSGWITVRNEHGAGAVPASYVELLPKGLSAEPSRPQSSYSNQTDSSTSSLPHPVTSNPAAANKKKGPAVAPKRGAKKLVYVTALYDYEARSEQEFSMSEGERFVLVKRDTGDGWADVERGGVVRSVPANYLGDG